MSTLKELKLAQKAAAGQNALIGELNGLVKDIERCEKTISDLKVLLERTNNQYTGPRTTRQDVDYLTVLLDCARKKLNWEKQVASLQKRTPLVLERLAGFMSDPRHPPPDAVRAQMLQGLQGIQTAMERLQSAAGTQPS